MMVAVLWNLSKLFQSARQPITVAKETCKSVIGVCNIMLDVQSSFKVGNQFLWSVHLSPNTKTKRIAGSWRSVSGDDRKSGRPASGIRNRKGPFPPSDPPGHLPGFWSSPLTKSLEQATKRKAFLPSFSLDDPFLSRCRTPIAVSQPELFL